MRVLGGLGRLAIATLLAGVLVAGLMLPYAVGLGLASNRVTDTIASTPVSNFAEPPPERTVITDDAGSPIAYVYDQNRVPVPLAQISPYLQQAIISTEDRRFMFHKGVDWRGTVRALLKNSQGDVGQQGGSTLTQQYVKNFRFLVEAKTDAQKADAIAATPLRKLQEAKLALTLELHKSKADIMEGYLNLVAFGPSVYGAQAASQYFFGVDATKLSIQQAALLAGMVNNPNKYNPFNPDHAQDALNRKNLVLDLMARDGVITAAQATAAKAASLGLERNPTPNGCLSAAQHETNGYFCQYVLDYLENSQGMTQDQIASGGYTIKTTLDPKAMKAAKAAVNKNADPSVAADKRVANVIAIVQPGQLRKILAMAANRPYGLDKGAGQTVQRLTTTFAPLGAGSTFKLFTTAEALSEGLGINSTLDSPAAYTSPLVPAHAFHNAGTYPSRMTMQQALATSPNTAFVDLEDQVGLQKVTDMAVALGMKGYQLDAGEVDRSFANSGRTYAQEVVAQKIASFTLGVSPVSPLELSNVGATLASGGLWCAPTPVDTVSDRNNQIVTQKSTPCQQAVPADLAYTLANAMGQDLTNNAGYTGTAYQAASDAKWTRVAASKTGTTQDYKSSAYLGFTPFYSGAVITWDYLDRPESICINATTRQLAGSCQTAQAMGQTTNTATKGMSGGSVPAATWMSAMTPLHVGLPDSPFPPSSNQYLNGSDRSKVPNVIGLSVDEAKIQLTNAGFTVAVVAKPGYGAQLNTVVDQTPKDTALPGSQVIVTTSAGA